MFTSNRHTLFLYLKTLTFPPLTPKPPYHLLHHCTPSPFSLPFCTNTSDSPSFQVSYLVHNFGFSAQFASKLCSTHSVKFKTAQKPESVLNFFRSYGFSDSQLRDIIAKKPCLLSCDPCKTVLPKFEFFLSKGAANSDIVKLVTRRPKVLHVSLKNHIIPTYELAYRFFKSDKDTIACGIHNSSFFEDCNVVSNIKLLIENGVGDSNITRLLKVWCRAFQARDLLKLVEELKELGFNPSKITFGIALHAKLSVHKTLWKDKVDAFKKWGWSDEDVVAAFRKGPQCMLTSIDKINLLMSFWVNQLGWDALALAKEPKLFGFNLERRIIPRTSVVQYLMKNGLRKKNARLTSPFVIGDKLFLDKYIKCFKEDSSYLLSLYEEKLNLAQNRDKTRMS